MRDDTTRVNSAQDDLIDFPVSNIFREHYAAQGLTYDIGRRQPKAPPRIPDWDSQIDDAHLENHELKNEIRLVRLENAELRRSQSNGHRPSAEESARRPSSRGFQGVLDEAGQSEDLDAPR